MNTETTPNERARLHLLASDYGSVSSTESRPTHAIESSSAVSTSSSSQLTEDILIEIDANASDSHDESDIDSNSSREFDIEE